MQFTIQDLQVINDELAAHRDQLEQKLNRTERDRGSRSPELRERLEKINGVLEKVDQAITAAVHDGPSPYVPEKA